MPKKFYVAIVVLLVTLMALSFLPVHGEREVYDTVVRLHVLANSDSCPPGVAYEKFLAVTELVSSQTK